MKKKIFPGIILLLCFFSHFVALSQEFPASPGHANNLNTRDGDVILENLTSFVVLITIPMVLLLSTGILYFWLRRKLWIEKRYSEQLLLSLEKEKAQISQELHNTVGQHVLYIKNQLIRTNQLEWMPSVDETIEKVRNISRELYPVSLDKYGLITAVDALVETIDEKHNLFVSHDLEALNPEMPNDQKLHWYRIIEACVSNTLQHAEATALRISATAKRPGIELIIQDNGKGFDKSILAAKPMGLLNIQQRIKYLKGKFDLETSPGNGTKYIFLIPA